MVAGAGLRRMRKTQSGQDAGEEARALGRNHRAWAPRLESLENPVLCIWKGKRSSQGKPGAEVGVGNWAGPLFPPESMGALPTPEQEPQFPALSRPFPILSVRAVWHQRDVEKGAPSLSSSPGPKPQLFFHLELPRSCWQPGWGARVRCQWVWEEQSFAFPSAGQVLA